MNDFVGNRVLCSYYRKPASVVSLKLVEKVDRSKNGLRV
jgi:hypothetical protein